MSAIFVFGKLPAHGDFISRGLTEATRAAWDAWASEGLQAARETLGDAFERAHDQAPPWRFRFGPSRFGPGWRTGALAPSIDRAGRRFVIVVGSEGAFDDERADALEGTLYRALGEALSVDELVVAAADAAGAEGPQVGRFWTLGGPAHPPQDIPADAPPSDLLSRVLTPAEAGAP